MGLTRGFLWCRMILSERSVKCRRLNRHKALQVLGKGQNGTKGVVLAVQHDKGRKKAIPTQVKDLSLVTEKRRGIVDAAVGLFVRKGYHQTTTREIAREAGFSIGTLYEYIASKEDILYLVCEAIHGEMEDRLGGGGDRLLPVKERLEKAMGDYVRVCDRMQDSILLIYRETASLTAESRRYVLENEERITEVFSRILGDGVREGVFGLKGQKAVELMAHNIVVLGHMWAFRRWFLRGTFSVDEYVRHQTSLIMGELTG